MISTFRPKARLAADSDRAHEFREIVLVHLDGAYNLARYLSGDPVQSEDIVQDAVLRAFRAFPQFRGGSARAWLFAIVRNCCRSTQAGRAGSMALVVSECGLNEAEAARLEQQPDPAPTPEEAAIGNSDVERVRRAIEAIPEPFREAIVLRELSDLSYAEIAEVTGVPIGTVMSRLARGRSWLTAALLPARDDGETIRNVR
ncbi:MAG TPA: sigma-70 family RNA polymerase sigma factor [Croceibacterium sp.]|jgi:RNA polymerase sigma-70 factor (ECF subfamily)|nr:sigma-70 family RNA polymerase sigma factor [Croceibacterium sp.]